MEAAAAPQAPGENAAPPPAPRWSGGSAAAWCVAAYFWFWTTTPYVRFSIFATIRFERLVVAGTLAAAAASGRLKVRFPVITCFFLLLFAFEYLSYAVSSYAGSTEAQWWANEYWKFIVFHLVIVWSITTTRDLRFVLIGAAFVALFYQFHSFTDYVRGGSYVYQQGMKRFAGTWGLGGGGAGNSMGVLGMTTLPLAVYAFQNSHRRFWRRVFGGGIVLCPVSIFLSGTRGAMVCAIFYAFTKVNKRNRMRMLGALLGALALAPLVMPETHWKRYTGFITGTYSDNERVSAMAEHSGESRIDGLIGGLTLGLSNPILGLGPGSSPRARAALRGYAAPEEIMNDENSFIALHNMYGQMAAEIGSVGSGIFLLMLWTAWSRTRRAARRLERQNDPTATALAEMGRALNSVLVLYFAYGMFGHELYSYRWCFFLGLQAVFLEEVKRFNARRETA